jgi:hypothetical protein
MDFSPDGGLLSAGRVVVVGKVTVVATTGLDESVELLVPPHDARPAMRSMTRSLFMTLVYTTMEPKMKIELTTYLLRVFLIAAPWGGCNH